MHRALAVLALAAPLAVAALEVDAPGAPQAVLEAPPPVELAAEVQAPEPVGTPAEKLKEIQRGIASWYGGRFHGRRTASGEVYDMEGLTAAHPSLPFGTRVRVQSLVNGRTVDVRINDRGPHIRKRVIDLSRGAARALGLIESGLGTKPVVLSVLTPADAADEAASPGNRVRKARRR
jgi:rare lipoprotein A